MGNKKNIRRAIRRTYLMKQKHMMEVINASEPRSKGLFTTTKCTVEQHAEATVSTSGFETTCDNKFLVTIDPDAATNDTRKELENIWPTGQAGQPSEETLQEMSEIEWTNEQIISLVNEYKKRPMLWDCNDNTYRIQTAKYEAWSEIAEIFGCPITVLRKKLNSIFASHRREKGKVRAGTRSTWFLYEHLSFLPTHIENEVEASVSSTKKRCKPEEQTQNLEQSSEEYLDEEELIIKEEPHESYQVIREVYLTPRPEKVKRKSTPAQKEKKLPVVEMIKSTETKTKDECDTFGEYIAMSLRKHDERTQAMIKQAINNILFEQEMKKYNSEHYTVVIANADENPLIEGDE